MSSTAQMTLNSFTVSFTNEGTKVIGPSLLLRAPLQEDIDQLWGKIFDDAKVMETFGPVTQKKESIVQETAQKIADGSPWHTLLVYSKSDFSFCGYVELTQKKIDSDKRSFVELRIAVSHDKQDKGFGREIVKAVRALSVKALEHIKKDPKLASFKADTLVADPTAKTIPIVRLFNRNPFTVELTKKCTAAIAPF